MTIEEMAEEYKEKHICNTCCADRQDCGNDCTFSRCGVQGFLAGLKAKTQWHDLRKDPKDVPDEGTYLVVWQNARGYRDTMMMRYEEDDEEKLHWIDGDGDCWDDDVIAWCEIPKFEEVEK